MVLCTELVLYIMIENWDNNMGDNADWNDESTKILCELFAEQVKTHNHSGIHLNKTGYTNVIEKFKDRTELSYSKMQFKNKWDKMRIKYANWKRLAKKIGIGWDPLRRPNKQHMLGGRRQTKYKYLLFLFCCYLKLVMQL
jgi:hypothetical protein